MRLTSFPLSSDEVFRKKFTAMAFGNIMEWFDFATFGALADVIGEQFFPPEAANTQFLKSLTIFGAAFLMRPIGGLMIGYVGDSIGRKRALEISICLMIIPTFLIGILPSYHHWGWTATALLIILRLLQGFACGGEIVGAFIYTIEATHSINRGFWGGCCKATGNLGSSLGLGMVAILRSILSKHDLMLWGWRIPFLFCLLFGIIGILLRASLREDAAPHANPSRSTTITTAQHEYQPANISTEASTSSESNHQFFKLTSNVPSNPSKSSDVWICWQEIVLVIFVAAFWGACYYSCFVWIMYFMSNQMLIGGPEPPEGHTMLVVQYAWTINFYMNLSLVALLPLGGYFGDWLGGRDQSINHQDIAFQRAMMIGLIIGIVILIPAFTLICTRTVLGAIIGQGLIVISIGIFGGNLPAFMVSQFDVQFRFKSVGLAYNIAHAVFSSSAPIIQTALVMSTDHFDKNHHNHIHHHTIWHNLQHDGRYRPPLYLMFIATISLLALLFGAPYCKRMRDERKESEDLSLMLEHITALDTQDLTITTSGSGSDKRFAHFQTAATTPLSAQRKLQLDVIPEYGSDDDDQEIPTATAIAYPYPLIEDPDFVYVK